MKSLFSVSLSKETAYGNSWALSIPVANPVPVKEAALLEEFEAF